MKVSCRTKYIWQIKKRPQWQPILPWLYIDQKYTLYTPKIENPTTNEQEDKLYTHITTL